MACPVFFRLMVALVLFGIPGPLAASMTAPQKSLRSLGGRPVWVPICSRRGVNGSASFFDATSTAIMDQEACLSPSWGTVTALKLVFSAFDMPPQGEIDRQITATGTAAIFVPSQNIVQATATVGTPAPAGSTVISNFAPSGFGSNGISLGQLVSAGGVTPGTYVTGVANSFAAGSGNAPTVTAVAISAPTTVLGWNGQGFLFSGLFVPVKFGGKRSFVIEPGHDVVTSDPVSTELPPNTWFLTRTAAAMSGIGLQLMDQPLLARLTVTTSAGAFQEFDSRGTTFNDQTMAPSYISNSGGGYWGPVALLALVTPSAGQALPGSALILGDSIAAGTGDAPDALGLEGYIQRSFENSLPFVSAARGATTALGLVNHGDGQYALSIDTGITDVMLAIGRNDIEQYSMTAAQVEANVQAIATRYINAGKRVWCFTIPPTTYSNDAWTSVANQSFPSATYTTGSSVTSAGSTTIGLAGTISGLTAGMSVALNGSSNSPAQPIAPGTTIVSINGANISISPATAGSMAASTKLYFGAPQASGSGLEVQREAYNSFARANWRNGGGACTGLIDIDAVVADQGGSAKWRTDLGQASADGVHPSAVLHQAAVNAGILSPSRFAVP